MSDPLTSLRVGTSNLFATVLRALVADENLTVVAEGDDSSKPKPPYALVRISREDLGPTTISQRSLQEVTVSLLTDAHKSDVSDADALRLAIRGALVWLEQKSRTYRQQRTPIGLGNVVLQGFNFARVSDNSLASQRDNQMRRDSWTLQNVAAYMDRSRVYELPDDVLGNQPSEVWTFVQSIPADTFIQGTPVDTYLAAA